MVLATRVGECVRKEDRCVVGENTLALASYLRLKGTQLKMASAETVVIMDVANGSALTAAMPQSVHEQLMRDYHSAAERVSAYGGRIWKLEGDCVIAVFEQTEKAVMGMMAFLHELYEFNRVPALAETPFLVRIGIAINREDSLFDVPDAMRAKASRKALNAAGHLEKACPIGRIAISAEVYETIDTFKDLFRPTSTAANHFILEKRPLMPQEAPLAGSLLPRQRKALPALSFLGWNSVRPDPDTSLEGLRALLQRSATVILGDTSSKPRGLLHSAATSDTVGLMEALSLLRIERLRVGIDEWQDTADLLDDHVILVGSGATNMYSLVLNDVFGPMRFYRAREKMGDQFGRSLDSIVVCAPNGKEIFYGRHAEANEDAGLMIMAKSAFRLDRTMVLLAGITGMGTQAVFNLFKDIALGHANLHPKAIGCIVSPKAKHGVGESQDIAEYYRKWRISGYEVLHQIDRDGCAL
ncbi:MAG: hypothetical protein U0R19_37725 [Bryobacteraceae bacterium]